jgi:ABC-type glutathione transport system ATPase component
MLTHTAEKVESVTAAAAPVVLEDVTKRYGRRRGAVAALDRVSLSFAAGSFTAVLGVSGSGKSTLLQCAAGLERPSAGAVRLCGTELTGLSHRRQAVLRRRRVGFVFQDRRCPGCTPRPGWHRSPWRPPTRIWSRSTARPWRAGRSTGSSTWG